MHPYNWDDLGRPPASSVHSPEPAPTTVNTFESPLRQDDLGRPPTLRLASPSKRARYSSSAPVAAQLAVPAASSSAGITDSTARLRLANPDFTLDLHPVAFEPQQNTRITQLEGIARSCVAAAWADSTRRTYEQGLRLNVGGAEWEVGASLLPMQTASQLMAVFARMDGMSWNTIQLNKSAIKAWHLSRGLLSAFEGAWSHEALLFWQGLKRRARHTPNSKRHVTLSELLGFSRPGYMCKHWLVYAMQLAVDCVSSARGVLARP